MDASKFSFLHRRPFWAVVLVTQALISILLCFQLIGLDFSVQTLLNILSLIGASAFGLIIEALVEDRTIGLLSASVLFGIFYLSLAYKIFERPQVTIYYPILVSIPWVISTLYFLDTIGGL